MRGPIAVTFESPISGTVDRGLSCEKYICINVDDTIGYKQNINDIDCCFGETLNGNKYGTSVKSHRPVNYNFEL